jgi:serine/threonine protein kinase
MSLAAGARLGPYEILTPLGEGGMGEVYKARDTRLDRTVAIKVLKGGFSDRFMRKAKTIGSLNHAHICTLHDVGPDYHTSRARPSKGRCRSQMWSGSESRFAKRSKPRIARASSIAI